MTYMGLVVVFRRLKTDLMRAMYVRKLKLSYDEMWLTFVRVLCILCVYFPIFALFLLCFFWPSCVCVCVCHCLCLFFAFASVVVHVEFGHFLCNTPPDLTFFVLSLKEQRWWRWRWRWQRWQRQHRWPQKIHIHTCRTPNTEWKKTWNSPIQRH